MGLTLDELLEIRAALEWGKNVDSYFYEVDESLRIINREIKLKELEKKIPRMDVNKNLMED